jgi:TnpA family transposase
MPRFADIGGRKLYRPDTGMPDAYPNLQPILTSPIDWKLIRENYDEFIKYTAALKRGTAEAETILSRFSKNGPKHPVYKAIMELGRPSWRVNCSNRTLIKHLNRVCEYL